VLALAAALTLALVLILRRPLTLVAFDPDFARATGRNVDRIDLAMMAIVLAVTVVGLKIVGLILIVALLIIPAVTARLWTQKLDRMALLAALFGGASTYVGAAASAAFDNLPTGATIVLTAGCMFVLSLPFALLSRWKWMPAVLEPPS
jgi:manganese/zinc/iron transport system permease protein